MDAQTTGECRYCLAMQLPAESESLTELEAPYVVAKVDGFLVMCDRTPLAPGHALLVPDEHVSSYSLLSRPRLRQAEQLAVRIADGFYEIANSTTLMVENGNEQASGQHAALHLIPAAGDVTRWFRQHRLRRLAEVWNLSDLHNLGGSRYVFAQQFARAGAVWDASDLPAHWLDRMINEQLGDDEWSWRDRLQTRGPEIRSDAVRANLAVVFAAVGIWADAPLSSAQLPPSQRQTEDKSSSRQRSQSLLP
jgi:diadenosine tetraphosphate (Ap4A) HIT family hydrolase